MPITPPLAPLTIGTLTLPNNLILAPMAGVTDGAFRVLCREQGVGFSVSELISAKGLAMRSRQTLAMLEFPREETPMAAQIFGSDPATMAEAARIIEERGVASVIDINMGCPVAKVVRGGAGAALLRDLPRAAAIIRSVRAAVRLPVTVKSRLGWDSTSIVVRDFVKMAVDSGAMAVAIHARTRAAMYTGTADWAALDGLQHLCGAIPFIANGDLQTRADLVAVHAISGCRGFMIGRGIMGRPWLFATLAHDTPEPEGPQRFALFRRHLLATMAEHDAKAVPLFRGHLFAYLKGYPGAAALRRDLANERDPAVVLALVARFMTGPAQEPPTANNTTHGSA